MKLLTDTDYIHALIAEGEHQQQDFKFEISDARKIAKTLSAFANTNGGRLLIGVKDNGKIAGVRSEEEKYMIEAAAQLYCVPEVEYSYAKLLQKSEMRKNMVMDLIYRGFINAANYSESHYNPRRSQIKTELRYLFVTTPNR